MAKKELKPSYYVLGEGASAFYDPQSKLKVISKEYTATLVGPLTKRVKLALKNSHINEVDEENVDPGAKAVAAPVAQVETSPVEALRSKADAVEYYQENFEVEAEDLEKFEGMKLKEMKEFLASAEEEEED